MNKIVLDIETQNSFHDVEGRANIFKLKISVVGIYDYSSNEYAAFTENELNKLEEIIKKSIKIIGFNIIDFDLPILSSYFPIPSSIEVVDIMQDIKKVCGFRVSLDNVSKTTLGISKTGNGLDAIRYFKEGKIEELKNYCLNDVKITKDIYEYGRQYNNILITSKAGKIYKIPVCW